VRPIEVDDVTGVRTLEDRMILHDWLRSLSLTGEGAGYVYDRSDLRLQFQSYSVDLPGVLDGEGSVMIRQFDQLRFENGWKLRSRRCADLLVDCLMFAAGGF
jgi:hypothetical protein